MHAIDVAVSLGVVTAAASWVAWRLLRRRAPEPRVVAKGPLGRRRGR